MLANAQGDVSEICGILKSHFDQTIAYNFVYVLRQLQIISQQADVH